MLVEGLLKKAQLEPFTNAGKPTASDMPYRVIWISDLEQIQISNGTTWDVVATSAANAFAIAYPIIIGSAAQVTAGSATHSTFSSALSAATTGQQILVLQGGWTENVIWTKKNYFVGSGHASLVTGTWQWSTGSANSGMTGIKLTDNMTIDSGITGLQIGNIWFASGKSFIDNATQNANFLMGYQE